MNLQLDEIAKAVGGTLEGTGSTMALGYSIDSRTIKPGELFFAIRGPRFDGHAFVKQVLERKAAGAVVELSFTESVSAPLVRVRSTSESLQNLARYVRRLWGAPIVGVTGSAGKTTTKEAIASVLSRKFDVLKSVGNLNNEFGLPLCLLKVERRHTMGVLEMGMSAKGEIRNLAAIAEPNEGVVTNVNPVHLEFFDSIEGIAAAKAELLEGLVEPGRTAYLNNDDPRVRAMARKFTGKVVTYAANSAASFRVSSMNDLGLGGTAFTVHHGRRDVNFVLPLLGKHNVANAAAAIAVAATHEVSWENIQSAIAGMKPEKMRGEVVRFKDGPSVIDDSYNSNPKALTEMIRFTGKLKGFSRKIIVAGEMLELGPEAAELHRGCGREAAKSGAALILGVRGEATSILAGARESGASEDSLRFFPDSVAAGEFLAGVVKQGDVVLLKGSRGVKLEQTMNALRSAFTGVES